MVKGIMDEERLYEKSKENFWFLMDCINMFWNRTAPPKNGQLYYINHSDVARLVVGKYGSSGILYFKAFFCNEVLRLHKKREGQKKRLTEELNIKEYELYFDGKKGKKYAIDPTWMNFLLDRKENERLLREVLNLKKENEEWEKISKEYFCPRLLMECLREVTYQCLKEYFLITDMEDDNGTVRELGETEGVKQTAKMKLYRRFVTAACQYEIFIKKFMDNDYLGTIWQEVKEYASCVEKLVDYTEALEEKKKEVCHGSPDGGTEEDLLRKQMELVDSIQKMNDFLAGKEDVMTRGIAALERGTYYTVHRKCLAAFIAIIAMVEFENINSGGEVSKKVKQLKMSDQLNEGFYEEYEYIFMEEVSMNKNISKIYAEFMETAKQEQLLQELCSQSKEVQKQALELVRQYFQKVRDEQRENMEFADVVHGIAEKCLGKGLAEVTG